MKEFHENHSNEIYGCLNDFMSPFLKELKRDVLSNADMFDLASIAAIPSPKLRRNIKA